MLERRPSGLWVADLLSHGLRGLDKLMPPGVVHAFDAHANGAYTSIAVAPITPTAGTALAVSAGDGALFPAAPFNISVWPNNAVYRKDNGEILRVTNKSGDIFTVTRAQDGSTARSIVIGDQVALAPTNQMIRDVEQGITPISIPAGLWISASGAPARATVGTWDAVIDTWTLHHGAVDGLGTGIVKVPGKWGTVNVYMTILTVGGGGNAVLIVNGKSMVDNNTIVATAADSFGLTQTVNVVGGTGLYSILMGTVTVTQDTQFRVIAARNGLSGSDTAGDVPFVNVILAPA